MHRSSAKKKVIILQLKISTLIFVSILSSLAVTEAEQQVPGMKTTKWQAKINGKFSGQFTVKSVTCGWSNCRQGSLILVEIGSPLALVGRGRGAPVETHCGCCYLVHGQCDHTHIDEAARGTGGRIFHSCEIDV